MWRIWWPPNNASKWQMGLNSVFKGLNRRLHTQPLIRWVPGVLSRRYIGWGVMLTHLIPASFSKTLTVYKSRGRQMICNLHQHHCEDLKTRLELKHLDKIYIRLIMASFIEFGQLPYILESNPHPTLIRTSFCRFLKQKKKVSSRF